MILQPNLKYVGINCSVTCRKPIIFKCCAWVNVHNKIKLSYIPCESAENIFMEQSAIGHVSGNHGNANNCEIFLPIFAYKYVQVQ